MLENHSNHSNPAPAELQADLRRFFTSIPAGARVLSETREEAIDGFNMAEQDLARKLIQLRRHLGHAQVTASMKATIIEDFRFADTIREQGHPTREKVAHGVYPYLDGTEGIFSKDPGVRARVERRAYEREKSKADDLGRAPFMRREKVNKVNQRLETWRRQFKELYGEDIDTVK